MKLRMLVMAIVATVMGVGVAGCPYVQGQPVCLVGHGYYAVKYTKKAGETATGACADKKGEFVGIEKYNRPSTPNDQTIAIKSETLTDSRPFRSEGRTDADIISMGKLTGGDPDANHFCTAPKFDMLGDGTPGVVMDADTGIGYDWSNLKFYVTPQIPGTQFSAELAYTEAGCTAHYDVLGVFPVVYCGDADDMPDDKLCAQVDTAISGLALNPDFAVKCDTDTLLCVLSGTTIPALKTAAH